MNRIQSLNQIPILFLLLITGMLLSACQPPILETASDDQPETLVIYSGRSENLVGPFIEQFEEATGIEVEVRYGGTAEMAATILEEGTNSPADLFYGQDAGALGALSANGRLSPLPADLLALLDEKYRSSEGDWIGSSGRARVVVYNTDMRSASDLPEGIWGFTDPTWQGKLGWAPTNGSFQAFVTALRQTDGEERAQEWLAAMLANGVRAYPNNTAIVEAVGKGEIEAGFVNHYYLLRFLEEQGDDFPARNYYLTAGDAGAMMNVAGAGIIDTSDNLEAALGFLRYLLSPESQMYFSLETNEYPLVDGIDANEKLVPLSEINAASLNLNDLEDLQGTLLLLQEVGALD